MFFLLQFMLEDWREIQAYYRSLSTPPKLVLFCVCKPFPVKRDYTEMESVHGLCCWQQGWHRKKKQTSRPVCCFPHYLREEHRLTMLCQYSGKLTSVIKFLKTILPLSAWKSPKSKALHFKKAQKTTKYLQDSFSNRREHFKPLNLPTWIHPRLHNSLLCQSCRRSSPQQTCLVILHFSNLCRFHKAMAAAVTVMGQPPVTPLSVATLTGKSQSWLHPDHINLQENSTHPECSGIPGLYGTWRNSHFHGALGKEKNENKSLCFRGLSGGI